MNTIRRALTIAVYCLLVPSTYCNSSDFPQSTDPRLEVALFAQQPDIVHPVALVFTQSGKLLAVESHTHFRPANYQGPKYDRIRLCEDTNGDGKADRFSTFFEGTTATMDIAVHQDGAVFIATRNEIIRLKDTTNSGKANVRERIIFLESSGNYPHNGLSGLCFDLNGNLVFGLGENLGAAYKLIGSDGKTLSGGGEGGNIYVCSSEGKNLKRYATGFWNPFGIHVDSFNRMIAVDNDPDSMPPCRLLHIVQGGDYGYQFRYGRSGRHPFQSWNGQVTGTLPMISGTGEGPCEVLCYESSGLPDEYFGNYFVTAWADHRLERFQLKEHGASFKSQPQTLVQGGKNFRPNGLAVAPDGSMFIADWVMPDYQLHSRGAIWHLRPRQKILQQGMTQAALQARYRNSHPRLAEAQQVRAISQASGSMKYLDDDSPLIVKVEAFRSLNKASHAPALLQWAVHDDPFMRHAVLTQLADHPEIMDTIKAETLTTTQRTALMIAQQRSLHPRFLVNLPAYLNDQDENIRFLASKWIADQGLIQFREDVERQLKRPDNSVRLTIALSTAIARMNGMELSDNKLADYFAGRLRESNAPDSSKLQWLRMVPPTHPQLSIKLLDQLAHSSSEELQLEAALSISLHPGTDRTSVINRLVNDSKLTSKAKLMASIGLETTPWKPITNEILKKRPTMEKTREWIERYGNDGDAQAGRRIFYHPQGPGCYRCHQIDGRGSDIGPDLSTLGRNEPSRIMDSLLQPSSTVAPHYQAWTLVMHDGRVLTGILAKTYLDEYTYLNQDGKPFTVKTHDIAETRPSTKSIMPEGILNTLTEQQVKDLYSYLVSRK